MFLAVQVLPRLGGAVPVPGVSTVPLMPSVPTVPGNHDGAIQLLNVIHNILTSFSVTSPQLNIYKQH